MTSLQSPDDLFKQIATLLNQARHRAVQSVNSTMVATYFEIGRLIVQEEQAGKHRAEYGKHLLQKLSHKLTGEFGRGFSVTNLRQMRAFYLAYHIEQQKQQTLSAEFSLSWSHYLKLIKIEDSNERKFYEIESKNNNWSLKR